MPTATILGHALRLPPPGLTTLRILPLLTATAQLTHAYMEHLTTGALVGAPPTDSAITRSITGSASSPRARASSAEASRARAVFIPIWFANFFDRGVLSVVGLNSATLLSCATNLLLFPEGLGSARRWYVGGLAAAVGHYAFVPAVMGAVAGLYGLCFSGGSEGEDGGEASESKAEELVKEWRGWHRMRWSSVDVVSWACFLVGAVDVLTP